MRDRDTGVPRVDCHAVVRGTKARSRLIHTRAHTHTHAHTHTQIIHTYIRIYVYMHTYTYIHVYTYVYIHTYIHIQVVNNRAFLYFSDHFRGQKLRNILFVYRGFPFLSDFRWEKFYKEKIYIEGSNPQKAITYNNSNTETRNRS